jgi:hypothetical protein
VILSARLKFVVLSALLLFLSMDRPCAGYYAVPYYDDADGLYLSAIKTGKKSPVSMYGLYSDFSELQRYKPNAGILTPISNYFVPWDCVKIDVPLKYDLNLKKRDPSINNDRLWADIRLKNTYEEYRRAQEQPHELLKGLSVPSFDRIRNNIGVSGAENGHSPPVTNTTAHNGDKTGNELPAIRNDFAPDESAGFSRGMQQQPTMPMQKSRYAELAKREQENSGEVKKKNILTAKKNTKKDAGNKRWLVVALLMVQKFIASNTQLLIIFCLVSALLVSLIYSNIPRE